MSVANPESVREAYHRVRDDGNDVVWTALGYEGKEIVEVGEGEIYSDLLSLCTDDSRIYAYVRIATGDEMSQRAKFAFITWIGGSVGVLKKAKVSTDKAFVKNIFQNFAKEILADEHREIDYDTVKRQVEKAGGANYGTGK